MRTVIIGDIHGCYFELEKLLEIIGLSVKEDRVIFIGDLIDRGEDPFFVIERVLSLQRQMGDRCIVLRGNHEQMMIDSFYDPEMKKLWRVNGAGKTIRSFYRHGKKIRTALPWLLSTKLYYETEDFIAAHAGVDEAGPKNTDSETFLWHRLIAECGTYSGKLFIYGHTPMLEAVYQDGFGGRVVLDNLNAVCALPATGSLGIDTGCVFGNKLTAMIIDGKTFTLRAVGMGQGLFM